LWLRALLETAYTFGFRLGELRSLRYRQVNLLDGVIALETTRAERAADGFETALGEGHYQGPIDAAQIVLGAALENVARRHKVWAWRPGRPRLSGFLDEIARRPSFTATVQPELEV